MRIFPISNQLNSSTLTQFFQFRLFLSIILTVFVFQSTIFSIVVADNPLLNGISEDVLTKNLKVSGKGSTFDINIYGLSPEDINDVLPPIRNAYKTVANIWQSKVTVHTKITFTNLGKPQALASGGGVLFVRFDKSPDQELLPIAAAEAITQRDLNSDKKGIDAYDVLIKINKQTPWHLNINKELPSNQYDLVTVLLHETYHNLIFSGALAVDMNKDGTFTNGLLLNGLPARFDLFLANEDGCAILDYRSDHQLSKQLNMSNNKLLAASVTNNRLFFHDQKSGIQVPLYSPAKYQEKSSIYHVDSSRGGKGTIMNRFIPSGFMQREIHQELKDIQKVFLDPNIRGARHCSFPLSNPIPKQKVSENNGFSIKSNTGKLSVPKWAIIVACVLVACTGITAFLCVSTFFINRGQR